MVKGVHTVICQVTDMSRACAFYENVLGLTPGVRSPYWSDFALGPTKIGLHPPFKDGATQPGKGWILGLETDDIRSLRQTLETAGVTVAPYHDTPAGAIIDFQDPDGNPIQAIQPGVFAKDLA